MTIASTGSISTQSEGVHDGHDRRNLADQRRLPRWPTLSSGAAKFSIQATFVSQLSDSLTTGIGNLVDANMATESAS